MHTTAPPPLYLGAPARIEAAAPDAAAPDAPARFSGELYTGAAVMGNVYVDLATLSVAPSVPVLYQHDAARVVGLFGAIHNDQQALRVTGELFSDADADARAIAAKARRGMRWQMSMGVFDYSCEDIPAGRAFSVNGREATGPAVVLRRGLLREGSIVALGADDATSATFFSTRAKRPASPEGASMPTQAEYDEIKAKLDAASAQAAQLSADNAALKASAQAAQAAQQLADIKALFADLGRAYSEEAAKPYAALDGAAFAALAADLREHHKGGGALGAHLTHSAFAATGAAAPAGESVLLASARALHGIK